MKAIAIRSKWTACKDGPWYPNLRGGGIEAYRIWMCKSGMMTFQRHEWRNVDGSIDIDDWILSGNWYDDRVGVWEEVELEKGDGPWDQ